MKKIGILTFHRAKNYGAVVQCYALLNHIKREFPHADVEIIDYQSLAEKKYYLKSVIRNAIKVSPKAAADEVIRNRYFDNFVKKLPLSKKYILSDDANKLFDIIKNKYDAVVVGSDAVFSWNLRKFPIPFFLGADIGTLKFSFAASAHGLNYVSASKEEIEYSMKALSNFDYLGVRDNHTEKFLKYCNVTGEIHHNCDPSLLLNMDDINYTEIQKKLVKAKVDLNKPLIIVMTADENIIKPIYEKYSEECEFISIYLHNPLIHKFIANLSPLEWAGLFKFGVLTVTEYFHGTLLSLKNSTPVISIDRSSAKNNNTKIKDVLLTRLKLSEMYYEINSIGTKEYEERVFSYIDSILNDEYENNIDIAINKEKEAAASFIQCMKEKLYK